MIFFNRKKLNKHSNVNKFYEYNKKQKIMVIKFAAILKWII